MGGVHRWLGLGSYPLISLAVARDRALELRRAAEAGEPLLSQQAKRKLKVAADAKQVTFEKAAREYIAAHEASWKNEKHRAQWTATLATYAYPKLGSLACSAIQATDVLSVLSPIWLSLPETATRLRGRIEQVLDYAEACGYRSGVNPARWRGNLKHLLASRPRTIKPQVSLDWRELPGFMVRLRKQPGVAPRALEFLILAAARTSEVIGAKWSEIDLQRQRWTVPASRMKAGRDHSVPLTPRMIELLGAQGEPGDYLFATGRGPLSNMAMRQVLRRMGIGKKDATVHGFRATFRSWCADHTIDRDVAELALAHDVGSKVEQAYQRSDMFAQRAAVAQRWTEYCLRNPAVVVELHPATESVA